MQTCIDDPLYMDAVDHMFGLLLGIPVYLTGRTNYEVSYKRIFSTYIQCRLPSTQENRELHDGREEKKEITEVEESDRDKFKNQLETLGKY